MSTAREHPRRRRTDGRPGLFVMGGTPLPGQDDLRSAAPPADLEPGNLPVWEVQASADATPADLSAAVVAALEWDRAAAAEPYQVDVTRTFEDTVRMGNGLSAAVRLELLADTMREQLRDGHTPRDPVDGAELDPLDGLPIQVMDDDDDAPEVMVPLAEWVRSTDESWASVADLEASAAPLTYAAPPPPPRVDVPTLDKAPAADPVRVMAWASRHDPRSLEFGVRQQLRAPAPLVDRTWPHGPILDQGTAPPLTQHDASACTGHAAVNAANVLELAHLGTHHAEVDQLLGHEDAMRVYDRAQELDDWPGESYPGTSILAAMKAGQELGLWGGYLWAFGTKDVAQALLQVGPVVIGIPWLSGMNTPGPDGIVTVGGEDLGGHALCLHAIAMKVAGRAGPWFGALQSWGPGVGDDGVIWFHHQDLGRLLRSRGEAAIPVPEAVQ